MTKRVNKLNFRLVSDTNIIVSTHISQHKNSPSKEFIKRWLNGEFILLYSEDIQLEYIKKLIFKKVPEAHIIKFMENLSELGQLIRINYYHLPSYPKDQDDVCFLLCAENGKATHLVSYDQHLLKMDGDFTFKILKPVPFLQFLRNKLL